MQNVLFKENTTTLLELYSSACEGTTLIFTVSLSRLMREIRTFGHAVEGSSVSPLTNAMGGLSGGRRGGDTSGAITAPSFVGARPRVRPLPFVFASGHAAD